MNGRVRWQKWGFNLLCLIALCLLGYFLRTNTVALGIVVPAVLVLAANNTLGNNKEHSIQAQLIQSMTKAIPGTAPKPPQ